MVPGIAGRLQDAILWLHSVTHQATFFLYGMSGPELLDRAIDLRSTGLLDHDAVDICLEDLSSVKRFQILVKK